MTHRIHKVKTLKKFVVSIIFQDGTEKIYDIKKVFPVFPQFEVFNIHPEIFEQVKVDVGGYGISWDDDLDLAAEEIWNNGESTDAIHKVDVLSVLGANLTKAREKIGITQKELADTVNMYQGDLSKIERGNANPSIKTLQRLAEGMGMRLNIEFVRDKK